MDRREKYEISHHPQSLKVGLLTVSGLIVIWGGAFYLLPDGHYRIGFGLGLAAFFFGKELWKRLRRQYMENL